MDSFWDDGKDSKSGGSGLTTVLLLVVFGVLGVSFFWKFIVFGEMEIRKTLKVDGNVGIGTTTLTDKLTVNGNVSATRLITPGPGAVTTNVKVGTGSGAALTTGANNILIGSSAGTLLTTGGQNVAIGNGALANHTGVQFTAVGHEAGLIYNDPAGVGNVLLGHSAGRGLLTGNSNTHVGYGAGFRQAGGSGNTFVGNATVSVAFGSELTGSDNTTVGNGAGVRIGGGANSNTLLGSKAGSFVSTGTNNTFVGDSAGTGTGANGVITGQQNTFIGAGAGAFVPTTIQNSILIGFTAGQTGAVTNEVIIGNASNNTFRINGTWQGLSDIRDKENIEEIDGAKALNFVLSAHPVKYTMKARKRLHENDSSTAIGFIAQQLQELEETLNAEDFEVVDNRDDSQYYMKHTHIIPLLVKAIQQIAAHVGINPDVNVPLRNRTGYGYEENQPWTPPAVSQRSEDTEYLIPSLNQN